MKEQAAKEMLCPFKLSNDSKNDPDQFKCEGSLCMGWDEYRDLQPIPKKKDGTPDYLTERPPPLPRNPPEGDCRMVPPEVYCNN